MTKLLLLTCLIIFFVNVGKSLAKDIPPSNKSPLSYIKKHYNKSFFLDPVNPAELINIIKDLKSNSSSGWDDVTPKVVKYCHFELLDPLLHIINLSFSQGIFPDYLKLAKVIPLFKNGDLSRFNNYRPISVLSVFSKLFERLFYNRLVSFLNQEDILYENQFGFRKSHSTQLALILLLDKITNALEDGNYVVGIFLDFSKAFDTVNHEILLKKLLHYGIRGITNKWISSYLDSRNQFVSFKNVNSSSQIVNCGVPQGSILGPLLFLIYINDLAFVSESLYIYMFADDTNVFSIGNNLQDLERSINFELGLLYEWLRCNQLSLNIKKTHFMVFSPFKRKCSYVPQLSINSSKIEHVHQTKFLGVILDDQLSFKEHVRYIKGKIHKSIGIIFKARMYLNRESLVSLYYSFLYPYILYCIVVWGGCNSTTLDPIIKAQKFAIRSIACKPKRTPSQALFNELKILQIHQIFKLQVLIFVFKYKNSLLPRVFHNYFVPTQDVHRYNTRQCYNFYPPRVRTCLSKRNIRYTGCLFWNSLDVKIKSETMTFHSFKTIIINKCL